MNLGADIDDARFVEVLQRLFGDVRDVARDLLCPSLVSRAITSNSSMWMEVKTSSLTIRSESRIESSRVLRFHGMNATRTLCPSASSPTSVEGPSAMMSPFNSVADPDQRLLGDAGVLVRALELSSGRCRRPASRIDLLDGANDDAGRVDLVDDAGAARADRGAGIARHHGLHPGADEGRIRLHERHRLALHVRAHKGTVRVIVLRNGISAAATETSCFGDTSMRSTRSGATTITSSARRRSPRSFSGSSLSIAAFAWATLYFASSIAER